MQSLESIFRKFRRWGLKGAVDYVLARIQEERWHRYFAKNSRLWQSAPERGVTVVAALSTQGSVHKTMRDFCFSLKDAGLPFQTFDLGAHEIPSEDIAAILTPRSEFRINRYSHLIELLNSPVQEGIVSHRGRIVFWEFEDGVVDAYPTLVENPGDVLTMSDYNYEHIKMELGAHRSVRKILYPLRMDVSAVLPKDECRNHFGFAQDEFIVFNNFSYASGWNRKNPMGALEAFVKAFRSDGKVRLVFKTSARRNHEEYAARLIDYARNEGVLDRVTFIDDYLTQVDLYNLTNACDVYLSLHRSEGFGLGIAEAMMMGKAAVVTAYSAPMEFCNKNNAILVPYRKTKANCRDIKWYASAGDWGDPDVDVAAESMRVLRESPERTACLGREAQSFFADHFSVGRFRTSMLEYLAS